VLAEVVADTRCDAVDGAGLLLLVSGHVGLEAVLADLLQRLAGRARCGEAPDDDDDGGCEEEESEDEEDGHDVTP
jgi:hypothetical protein